MGEFMRRFWIPAMRSTELVPDGQPLRLKLLGEKLIAFRDSSGRVGVMDHRCPHRGASLWFARNEDDGLRCVYHGWKYDHTGQCVDMANVPVDRAFGDKVHTKAYIARERKGVIWVYMGDAAQVPPLPAFEASELPEESIEFRIIMLDCNWLQALEGDLDTSHVGFLHFGDAQKTQMSGDGYHRDFVLNRAPEYEIEDTPYGLTYGAYRPAEHGGTYWRVANYIYPFYSMPPISSIEKNVLMRAWIPIDDEHCLMFGLADKAYKVGRDTGSNRREIPGASAGEVYRPDSTDWLGRYRLVQDESNDYQINREIQKHLSYTGIDGVRVQDKAIVESMGPQVDHTFETLAPSDIAIVRVRRVLLATLREFTEMGKLPPAVGEPDHYRYTRGGYYVDKEAGKWRDAVAERVRNTPALVDSPK
jgi:phenylpropionate dioxygenase-like ring-hydroxylating dioxygenase large terminal subunit